MIGGIADEAGITIREQVAVHRELGWRQMELRRVDGVALADLPPARVDEVVGEVLAGGLEVTVLDSRIANWSRPITADFRQDLDELEALGRIAARLGTRYVRVMSYPNAAWPEASWRAEVLRRLAVLARHAEAAGLVLLHENCHGWAATRPERALELLEQTGSDSLRLLFDTGNPVEHGYDGLSYLRAALPFVDVIHVKDAVPGDDGGPPRYVLPGAGAGRVRECLALALGTGFRGPISIEPHTATAIHVGRDAPAPVLRATYLEYARSCATLVRGVLAEAAAGEAAGGR